MVDLNLVNYIRQLLKLGYDINSIRNRLITAGYDPNLINEAVNYVYQATPEQAPKPGFLDHFRSKKFIVVFSSIILLVIVSSIILMFAGRAPPPIEIYVSPSLTEITQGEDLEFTKTLYNLEEMGMVSLGYDVIDMAGAAVISDQETVSTQAVTRSSKIKITEDVPPGDYTLRATARFGEQRTEATFTFTVIEKIEEVEEVPEETPEVEGPDNDNDGIPDSTDTDDDNDGIPDTEDQYPLDHDNDGIPDSTDDDSDDDGVLDKFDNYPYDRDNDGIRDIDDNDNDNDGIQDPEDTYPFDYDNDGVLDKEDDAVGRAYGFPPEQEKAEFELKCTQDLDCNDYDICTTDRCVEGACEHTRLTPCCGNFICEGDETPSTCPQDCQEVAATTSEAEEEIEEIMAIAEKNPEKAASRCELIERTADSDECFNQLARKTGNSVFCGRAYSEKTKNTCYMYFVMSKDQFQLCDEITDRYLRNSCYSISHLKSIQ